MSWSPEQIACVEGARFAPSTIGYEREDVERLRRRAVIAMRAGKPLPDLDAMVLRRTARGGLNLGQVDGLRTVLSVWRRTTPIEDPQDVVRRAPELIVGSWCGRRFRPEQVAARPGWQAIPGSEQAGPSARRCGSNTATGPLRMTAPWTWPSGATTAELTEATPGRTSSRWKA